MEAEKIDSVSGEVFESLDIVSVLGPPEFSKSVANIIPALCQARLEMADIVFGGWNADQNYAFRKAVDICAATGPALAQNGIMVFPSVLESNTSEHVTKYDKKMILTSVTMAIKMMHKSGEFVTQAFQGTALDTGDKGIFKAYTGCMKYHLLLTFQLGGEDAENGQNGEGERGAGSGRQQAGRHGSGQRSGQQVKTATITAEQAENLKMLIPESGYPENKVLEFYRIKELINLPVVKYNGAVSFLEKAIKKKKEADPGNETKPADSGNGKAAPEEGKGASPGSSQQPPSVSLDQVQKLQTLIKETATDEAKFLQHLKVETLAFLPASRFDEAVKALEAKKKKAEATAGAKPADNGNEKAASEEGKGASPRTSEQPSSVSLEQVQKLQGLIKETAADEAKFLQHLKVETLAHLPASRFDEAIKALEVKKSKNNVGANSVQGAVNQLVATLTGRNIAVQVDEATGDVQATPGYQDTQGKAFLKSLGFKMMIGGKKWIKEAA
jgi:hypothetical protein